MKIFLNNIRFIILMGVILSFAGCIEDDAELPKVVAGFTYTVNETGTVTFLNTSTKATKFVWDFGDEETSTEINPVKTYLPGTFFVSLTASNVAGASNVFKDTLTIVIKDKITLPITFDNTNVDYEVTTFNGASFAIVDNPNVSGTNNKATKVGALTNSGVAFEGMFMDMATQIDLASKKTIAMNVLATAPVTLLLKLEEGTAAAVEVTANHGGTGWENLKFNFTSSARYSRLTLFVDGPGTTAGVFHIDDIEQKTTEALTAPTTAAPTPPTRAASDVISIYGGTYANLAGVNYSPNWGQSPPVVVNPSFNPGNGNLALAYTNLNFQGTEFASVDASGMEFLHVDIWVASGTNRQIKVSPINNGAGATGAAEVQVNIPLTPGAWNSVDLPKSSFTGMTWNAIQQMIFNAQFNGDGSANTTSRVDIYLDNIYFYRTSAPATAPTTAAPIPPARAASDVISIYGGTYTNLAGVNYSPNWGQSPPVVVNPSFNPGNGNLALAYTNLNFQGTEFASVDASGMEFLHVDIWVASGTNRQIKVSPINNGAGATGAAEVQVNVPLTPGAWNSVDLPKSSFTGMTWNALQQMIFNAQFNGDGSANTTSRVDIYLDNIYFYKSSGGGGSTNLITNGGFESGDASWILFPNGGATSISSTENNGGTKSAKIESGKFDNPGLKQERFAAGTVLANTQYEVKFDVKQQALADGAIVNAFVFSETSNSNPAVQHPLTPITLSQGNWSSNALTFTTASDVSGGISLLIEVVCGGADSCNGVVFIDNVSITKK